MSNVQIPDSQLGSLWCYGYGDDNEGQGLTLSTASLVGDYSWSVIDDDWHWSVFPSCLKWSASDALINLFSFGWFCLISNGRSLQWEHTVIRIKLDLLTFYKISRSTSTAFIIACVFQNINLLKVLVTNESKASDKKVMEGQGLLRIKYFEMTWCVRCVWLLMTPTCAFIVIRD